MMTIDIPEATYAVFTTPPVNTSNDTKQKEFAKIIKETWRCIFKEWFKETKYIFDESKMDFEFYDERCHGREDTVIEIYSPILEK